MRRRLVAGVLLVAAQSSAAARGTWVDAALPQYINLAAEELEGKSCSTENRECGDFLICEDELCRMCVSDDECAEQQPEHACLSLGTPNHPRTICAHKRLVPLDMRDCLAIGLALLLCAISAGGGIGGGGLLLPLFILVLAFTPHDASPLTNATVFGGATANLLHYVRRRHPSGRKSLINFEVALMMEPMTMLGATLGVVLNKMFPGWLITLLVTLVLGITTRRTLLRGLDGWRKESAALAVGPSAAEALLEAKEKEKADGREASPTMSVAEMESAAAAAGKAGSRGNVHEAPLRDVATLVLALSVTTAISVLRGPNYAHSPLGMHCGSTAYWGSTLVQLGVLLAVSLHTRRLLLARQTLRVDAGYDFLVDDVQWTERSSFLYPLACGVAGLCAGLFGIGGGIIKGPLMLEMGLLPQVASATSAFMIFFTAASATLQYALLNDLRPNYGATLYVAGLIGTGIGQLVVGAALRRYGRPSLIVLIIAGIIGGSTLVMSVTGVWTFVNELKEGKSQGFRPLCESTLVDD